ncbi:phospholipase A1-Igamma2, chloroplastic-like [Cryptomeria japonica]|uniref:phospholipase A1-Igamma2, chloroplastic-like n=1 Tax=Cryptomeria japonica TaxID=3369 RepID=UPI0027D9F998|nr:phospholipase A1-Igamma2, chloroplastic-like [Cryptomeria japonica]
MSSTFSMTLVQSASPTDCNLAFQINSTLPSPAHLVSNKNGEQGSQSQHLCDMWRDIQGAHNWNGLLDPMDPILKSEVLRYGNMAKVCYDAFDGESSSKHYGECKYSKTSLFDKMGMSECGYRATKYIYANTNVLAAPFVEKAKDRAVWLGFIAVCESEKEIRRLGRRDIVVAWRGTQTTQEWIQDLRDFLIPARLSYKCERTSKDHGAAIAIANDGVRIETGFLSCYTSIISHEDSKGKSVNKSARGLVNAEIRRLLNVYKNEIDNLSITFTGHSLGAALTTLSAYDTKNILKANCYNNIPVTVFSFASPRVGNLSFAKKVEDIGLKVMRLVNKGDVVPKVPGVFMNEKMGFLSRWLSWLPWTYFHVGVEVSLGNNSSSHQKSVAYYHHLEVYLRLLAGCKEDNN